MSVDSKMTAIADAIRAKAGTTVALTLDDMAAAIAALEVSSGGIECATGTVTFVEENTTVYDFLGDTRDNYDVFICLLEYTESTTVEYIKAKYIWGFYQYRRPIKYYNNNYPITACYLGYNKGGSKYYTPMVRGINNTNFGVYSSGDMNGHLGVITYRWFAIKGVSI